MVDIESIWLTFVVQTDKFARKLSHEIFYAKNLILSDSKIESLI